MKSLFLAQSDVERSMMNQQIKLSEMKKQDVQFIPYLHRMELFTLARSLDNIFLSNQKIGDETRFSQSGLRFGQSAHMAFQNRQITQIQYKEKYIKVDIKGFGVFGSNGALPLHITEHTYEKKQHQKQHTFNDFLDIFHHRLISLFYKSWRNAQDVISLDHKDAWQFTRYIASTVGMAEHQTLNSEIHIYSKLYYASFLLNKNMPLENLHLILQNYFSLPIAIQENIGQWVAAEEFKTILSYQSLNTLGQGLLIGDKIFDATQKFRISIGPLTPEIYLKFLRGKTFATKLTAWIEQYTRYQYQWDVELIIDKNEISQQFLGTGLSLGFTSWLGQPKHNPIVIIQY